MASEKTARKSAKKSARRATKTAKTARANAPSKKSVAKKAPAERVVSGRVIYGVSPLRGMAVSDWVTQYAKGWQEGVVRRVMQIVEKAAPAATASIKWRMPVYEENGPFLFLRIAKAHVTVGFWRGAELRSSMEGFEAAERMGHIKIHTAGELDEKGLEKTVKDAVRLNREKGSPTIGGR